MTSGSPQCSESQETLAEMNLAAALIDVAVAMLEMFAAKFDSHTDTRLEMTPAQRDETRAVIQHTRGELVKFRAGFPAMESSPRWRESVSRWERILLRLDFLLDAQERQPVSNLVH
jgi:hypothetical protein